MQFLLDKSHRASLFEQAREQMITALHTGKLRAGDRLPSVRQTAQKNGINLKTAFSIYQRLRDAGYVELKTGSGAYVSDVESVGLDQAYRLSVFELIKSNLSQAERLKLNPGEYSRLVSKFVEQPRKPRAQIAVIECNEEQVNLFSSEISSRLPIKAYPVLLSDLEQGDRKAGLLIRKMDYVVTTDYHFNDVKKLLHPLDSRILRLRLNPAFVPELVNAARRGRLLMVVSNADFFPAFRRNLLGIGTPPAILDNITAMDDRDIARLQAAATRVRAVYISPVCDERIDKSIQRDITRLEVGTMLSNESIEMIEAVLLFDE